VHSADRIIARYMSAYLSVTLSYCVKKAKDVEIYYHFCYHRRLLNCVQVFV